MSEQNPSAITEYNGYQFRLTAFNTYLLVEHGLFDVNQSNNNIVRRFAVLEYDRYFWARHARKHDQWNWSSIDALLSQCWRSLVLGSWKGKQL